MFDSTYSVPFPSVSRIVDSTFSVLALILCLPLHWCCWRFLGACASQWFWSTLLSACTFSVLVVSTFAVVAFTQCSHFSVLALASSLHFRTVLALSQLWHFRSACTFSALAFSQCTSSLCACTFSALTLSSQCLHFLTAYTFPVLTLSQCLHFLSACIFRACYISSASKSSYPNPPP